MAHTEEWARRLLLKMESPRELLRRRRYWTAVFLRIYLDHVEKIRFRDPAEGLKLAKVAPRLALLVPEAAGAKGRREHRENLVRAHAVLAGAYQVASRPAAAAAEYALAVKIADSEALGSIARADLDLRLATSGRRPAATRRERAAEALALVDSAEAVYRKTGDRRRLAESYAVRGYVLNEAGRFEEAVPWHGQALTLAISERRAALRNPKRAAMRADVEALARVAEAARVNLAHACAQASDLELASKALPYIQEARRELKGRPRSLTRHLLEWTEGRLFERLIWHARAETRYKMARRGFALLGAPWELALCSLDLAALHLLCNEYGPAAALAADTFERFCELAADHEAIAALSVWVDAVEAGETVSKVEAAITAARETLEARRGRGR